MKFAHMADCHIGGWREPELRDLTIKAFKQAIETCINENVGFILISGDLFNTALPQIELIKDTAEILKLAANHNISVYTIPGSHDFSISGKTMMDVLEKAGLVKNVMKFKNGKLRFTKDKTSVKITGLFGRRGGLERGYYENLEKEHLEKETGFKVFMFHTALNEFKPDELERVEAISASRLPKNFNYYAGGHVHYIFSKKYNNGLLTFPGALFPNNFKELEEFKHGGFYIVDDKLNLKYIPIKLKDVVSFTINADNKNIEDVENELLKIKDVDDKIVAIRVEGTLKQGRPNDINFKKIIGSLSNAYSVLKNTAKLSSKELEEINIKSKNIEEIENEVINEHLNKSDFGSGKLIYELINIMDREKEDEKNIDFENRLLNDLIKILNLGRIWNDTK